MTKWFNGCFIGLTVVFVLGAGLRPAVGLAEESYPTFDRDFWVHQQDLAKGKMQRGAGLGVVGLVAVWPTALLISKAIDNPQKYTALSALLGVSALAATLHGFGSVGFGHQQKRAAARFVADYDANPVDVDPAAQRAEYLNAEKKSTRKVMVFGAFLSTQAAILLSNGIVQSVRRGRDAEMGNIHIWPYYVAGSVLLAAGAGIIWKSKRKLDSLNTLHDTASLPAQSGIVPWYDISENGTSSFGISLGSAF